MVQNVSSAVATSAMNWENISKTNAGLSMMPGSRRRNSFEGSCISEVLYVQVGMLQRMTWYVQEYKYGMLQ